MAFKVIYRKRFISKLSKLQLYLQSQWSNKVAEDFIETLYKRIGNIKLQPNMGKPFENSNNTRSILISKHNRLVYRITETHIVVINLIDTRQKKSLKKY